MRSFSILLIFLAFLTACGDSGQSSPPEINNQESGPAAEATPEVAAEEESKTPFPGFADLQKAAQPDGRKEILLFGEYDPIIHAYFTMVFLMENGEIKENFRVPLLASPQKEGFHYFQEFWEADSVEVDWRDPDEEGNLDHFHTFTSGIQTSTSPQTLIADWKMNVENISRDQGPEDFGGYFYENTGYSVLSATSDYVSFQVWQDGYAGGAHGYYWNESHTLPLEWVADSTGLLISGFSHQLLDSARKVFVERNYSAQEWKEIQRQLYIRSPLDLEGPGVAYVEVRPETKDLQIGDLEGEYVVEQGGEDFVIMRERGKKRVLWKGYGPAPYVIEHTYRFEVEYDGPEIPKEFQNQAPLPVPYDSLHCECRDLMLSPGENILLVESFGNIELFNMETGKSLGTFEFGQNPHHDGPILLEWAIGDHAQRWANLLKEFKE